ncbi:MAG: hypothetical protein Q9186_000030 [Xanthomendoza sp. 1 TL-2023]
MFPIIFLTLPLVILAAPAPAPAPAPVPAPRPGLAALGTPGPTQYAILAANLFQGVYEHQEGMITVSETMTITVKGVNDGALNVTCAGSWPIDYPQGPGNAPGQGVLGCSDPAVVTDVKYCSAFKEMRAGRSVTEAITSTCQLTTYLHTVLAGSHELMAAKMLCHLYQTCIQSNKQPPHILTTWRTEAAN